MARNGQFGRLAKSAGFRRSPREHAGAGAIRQEKTPTENGWGFDIGGGLYHSVELYSITPAGWCGSTRSYAARPRMWG